MSASTENLSCLVLSCTLKPSPAESSSELLGSQVLSAFADLGVRGAAERVVDHDVRFGVSLDEGDGDAWPALRQQVLDADILVLVTPIWMGQPSSVAKMVLERLDAELSETDEEGRLLTLKTVFTQLVENSPGTRKIRFFWPKSRSETKRSYTWREPRMPVGL